MVQRVIEAGDQRQCGQARVSQRPEHQRRAEAHENDADVLNAVIGQESLQVVLHKRVQDSQ